MTAIARLFSRSPGGPGSSSRSWSSWASRSTSSSTAESGPLDRRAAILWSLTWIGISLLFAGWVGLQLGKLRMVEFLSRREEPERRQPLRLPRGVRPPPNSAARAAKGPLLGHLRRVRHARPLPLLRRNLPFTSTLHGHRFVVSEAGRWMATPLLLALLAIEGTDILFAVDSIAAVLAVSTSPFIVFSSNVFAILGLRALYVLLSDFVSDLRYLHYGLGGLLLFVGGKMLTAGLFSVPQWASLVLTVAILTAAIVPSLVSRRPPPPCDRAIGAEPAWHAWCTSRSS